MTIYNEVPKGITKPKLTLGNIDSGGMVLRGRMGMFRMGQRLLGDYEYDTLDIAQCKSDAQGGNKHLTVSEIERLFDRNGKGRPGATITEPRMTHGAVVFMPMDDRDGVSAADHRYYTRQYTNDTIPSIESGYRSWGVQDALQESIALQFRLTQMESGREAYFDNSRFMVSNILWEFSPDGGRGRWYQLYELPNQKVRITLPEATQQIRLRAISNNPDEWVQAVAVTPRTDFQNRFAVDLYWYLTGESDDPEDYIEFDDLGYLIWPEARGGRGDIIYTLYWTPEEDMSDAIMLARTKMNDLAPGEFSLPVRYIGGYLHIFAQDISGTLHIKTRFTRSIADCEVLCSPESSVYTGSAITPEITVRFRLDLEVLPPEYYTVEYVNNVNAGTATVIVTGQDCYYGTPLTPGAFDITPADIASCVITPSTSSMVYNATERKPDVTVDLDEFRVSSSDYTLSYLNNINVGTATIVVRGKGNMMGESSANFSITPASLVRIALDSSSGIYARDWSLPGCSVYGVDDVVLTQDDYSVTVVPNTITDAGSYVYTATGRRNYTGSVSGTYTVERADVANVEFSEIGDRWVTGSEICPKPTVTRSETAPSGAVVEKELSESVDFYYSWEDNVTAGTGKVIITGIGNYCGTAMTTFTIFGRIGDGTWGNVNLYTWQEILEYNWGQLCGTYD